MGVCELSRDGTPCMFGDGTKCMACGVVRVRHAWRKCISELFPWLELNDHPCDLFIKEVK